MQIERQGVGEASRALGLTLMTLKPTDVTLAIREEVIGNAILTGFFPLVGAFVGKACAAEEGAHLRKEMADGITRCGDELNAELLPS